MCWCMTHTHVFTPTTGLSMYRLFWLDTYTSGALARGNHDPYTHVYVHCHTVLLDFIYFDRIVFVCVWLLYKCVWPKVWCMSTSACLPILLHEQLHGLRNENEKKNSENKSKHCFFSFVYLTRFSCNEQYNANISMWF